MVTSKFHIHSQILSELPIIGCFLILKKKYFAYVLGNSICYTHKEDQHLKIVTSFVILGHSTIQTKIQHNDLIMDIIVPLKHY